MDRGQVNFEAKDKNYTISTNQTLSEEEFVERIATIEVQKMGFESMKVKAEDESKRSMEYAKVMAENASRANEDLEKAKQFLRKNHKEAILLQIDKKIEEKKAEMAQQMPMPQMQTQAKAPKIKENK